MSDLQDMPPIRDPLLREAIRGVAKWWWVGLVTGAFWIVISVVVLKFNHASVTTVGILIGIMFLLASAQEFAFAVLDRRHRWLWALFAALLFAGGIVSLIHPRKTFAGFADILGFVFLLIGITWTMRAFAERTINELWWLTLTSGILMVVLAFWTSGQFYLVRAATLLVFAGIWALMLGINDIVRAFQIRKFASDLTTPAGHDGGGSEAARKATPSMVHPRPT